MIVFTPKAPQEIYLGGLIDKGVFNDFFHMWSCTDTATAIANVMTGNIEINLMVIKH
jgi:hypothetical protein